MALSQSVESAGQTIVGSNLIINLLLGGSLNQIWTLINTLQICVTMSLYKLPWPANTTSLFAALMLLTSFGFVPVAALIDQELKFSASDPLNNQWSEMGMGSKNFILNQNFYFLITVLNILTALGVTLLTYLGKYCRNCTWFKRKVKELSIQVHHNLLIRTFLEGCLDFSIHANLHMQVFSCERSQDCFVGLLAYVVYAMAALFPWFILYFLHSNVHKLGEDSFKKKFGSLYEDTEHMSAYLWSAFIFTERRFLLGSLIYRLQETSISIVMSFNIILSMSEHLIAVVLVPYSPERMHKEHFNLAMTTLFSISLILICDFVPKSSQQSQFGLLLCMEIFVLFAVNITFVVRQMLSDLCMKLKRYFVHRRLRQQRQSKTVKTKKAPDEDPRLFKKTSRSEKRSKKKLSEIPEVSDSSHVEDYDFDHEASTIRNCHSAEEETSKRKHTTTTQQ